MPDLTLETLAKRVEELERKLARQDATAAKDWRQAAGMFADTKLSRQIDQQAEKVREADRAAARSELGE